VSVSINKLSLSAAWRSSKVEILANIVAEAPGMSAELIGIWQLIHDVSP
jgi:hypothetical protein